MVIPYKRKKSSPTYKSQQFWGKVVEIDGERKVVFNAPALYKHFLKTVCKVGDEISLYLTNKRPKRSIAQNNYYRLYLSLIAQSSGHTVGRLHAWAKGRFLSKGISEVFGDKTRETDSTTDLNIGEFCEFLYRIEEKTGIPLPNTEPFLKPLTIAEYNELKDTQKLAYSKLKVKIVLSTV